jgi:hypothetical protein
VSDNEWQQLVAMLDNWWPGEFTDEAADAYRVLLDAHEARRVVEVLAVRARRGDTFRPSGAELCGALTPDVTSGRGSSAALVAAMRRADEWAGIRRRETPGTDDLLSGRRRAVQQDIER